MRTTIDIPDHLLRRAKATAALRGQKLKDLIASYIERGLDAPEPAPERRGHPEPLPEFPCLRGKRIRSLSNAEIEEIMLQEDLEKLGLDRPARR